jgi:2-dehydro-3-deoxygluconokinase
MALVAPDPPAPLTTAESVVLSHGGAESNVAICLARLGSRVEWCSRLGDDALGRRVLREVAAEGVGVDLVEVDVRARTGVYFKDPGPGGTAVVYYRDGSAASAMTGADVDRALSCEPRVLHLSGVTPALSESCAAAMTYAMDAARRAGVVVSFDVNYRPALWPDGLTAARELLRLAQLSDLVFVGLDEALALWNTATDTDVRTLLAGPTFLVVKDGPRDSAEFELDTAVRLPAPVVDVIEPVGAGDAFAAGWLHAYLLGMDSTERLRLGHAVAADALSSPTDHRR